MLPYELLFRIASFCKPRRLCALSLLCRSTAPLCLDEALFKQLVQTRYKSKLEPPENATWKDVFCFIFALHRRLANKPVPSSMLSYVSYDVFILPQPGYRHPCTCKSTFGYYVQHKPFIGRDEEGKAYFQPFQLPLMNRKIKLYAINFEQRARKIKHCIEHSATMHVDEDSVFPPFNNHMIIADGIVLWSLALRKYVLVYEMELIYRYYCKKTTANPANL